MGIIYGYVALRTNTIRYSLILHIIHNTFSSLLSTVGLIQNVDGVRLQTRIMIIIAVIGVVLFFTNFKNIKLSSTSGDEIVSKKIVYANWGMILFYIVSVALIIFSVIIQILAQV